MLRVLLIFTLLFTNCSSTWIIIKLERNESITGWCTSDTITMLKSLHGDKFKVVCSKIGSIGDTISNVKD